MNSPKQTEMKPKIKAVAFDMDGLLASSEDVYIHVGTETLRRRGKPFEDDLRHKMMGLPGAKSLQVMIDWHGLTDSVETLLEESEQLFWHFAEQGLSQMPGASEMLDLLDAQDIPRCVVTSGYRDYAERVLSIIGLRDRFPFLITASDVVNGKPAPEPYLMAAEKLGVEPANLLVLEDSSNGCKAGIAAGAYAVAVPSPHTHEHDFTGAQFIADTLSDPRLVELFR